MPASRRESARGALPVDPDIITPVLAERLAGAIRLRNILVHGYLDIDHGRLFDELDWIENTADFARVIDGWLEAHIEPGSKA